MKGKSNNPRLNEARSVRRKERWQEGGLNLNTSASVKLNSLKGPNYFKFRSQRKLKKSEGNEAHILLKLPIPERSVKSNTYESDLLSSSGINPVTSLDLLKELHFGSHTGTRYYLPKKLISVQKESPQPIRIKNKTLEEILNRFDKKKEVISVSKSRKGINGFMVVQHSVLDNPRPRKTINQAKPLLSAKSQEIYMNEPYLEYLHWKYTSK